MSLAPKGTPTIKPAAKKKTVKKVPKMKAMRSPSKVMHPSPRSFLPFGATHFVGPKIIPKSTFTQPPLPKNNTNTIHVSIHTPPKIVPMNMVGPGTDVTPPATLKRMMMNTIFPRTIKFKPMRMVVPVTSPTSTDPMLVFGSIVTGRGDLQSNFSLQPTTSNVHGVSQDITVAAYHPQFEPKPGQFVLYSFSHETAGKSTELALIHGMNDQTGMQQNGFEAIYQGRSVYSFNKVPVMTGHTYRRSMMYNNTTGLPTYSIMDLNNGNHQSFSPTKAQADMLDMRSRKWPMHGTSTFLEYHNKTGTRITTGAFPAPIDVHISNMKQWDGNKSIDLGFGSSSGQIPSNYNTSNFYNQKVINVGKDMMTSISDSPDLNY